MRRQFRHGRLLADDDLDFGDEADDQLSVRAHGGLQGSSPRCYLGLTLAKDLADQEVEGLHQSGVGNVALVLVELARRKKSATWNERFVDLVDYRGLAHARIA